MFNTKPHCPVYNGEDHCHQRDNILPGSFPVQGHMSKGSKIMVTFDFTPKFGYPTIEMKINVHVA